MRKFAVAATALALLAGSQFAVVSSAAAAAATTEVEMAKMTWPELKAAMAAGKTTALIYTGGTEQRGPQNIIDGHNVMGRPLVRDIALKLGNAIAFPILPYSPTGMSKDIPGSINLSPEVLGLVLEQLAEGAVANGFKNVILMGDSGGGQPDVYDGVAKKLDAKYGATGVHVYYAGDVYLKANREFVAQTVKEGLPASGHGAIPDTSLMLLLESKENEYVRKDQLANAVGDPVLPQGQKPDPNAKRMNNGITGDARKSSKEYGKRLYDMKLDAAVKQIQSLVK